MCIRDSLQNVPFEASTASVKLELLPSCLSKSERTRLAVKTEPVSQLKVESVAPSRCASSTPPTAELFLRGLDSPASYDSAMGLSPPGSSHESSSVFSDLAGYESAPDQGYDTPSFSFAASPLNPDFFKHRLSAATSPDQAQSVFADLEDMSSSDFVDTICESYESSSMSSSPVGSFAPILPHSHSQHLHQQLEQQQQQQQQQNLKNIQEEVETPNTPTPEDSRCSEQQEAVEKPDKESACIETEEKPEPTHHTESVSADLGDSKHPDIDTVPTKESAAGTNPAQPQQKAQEEEGKDIPDGLLNPEPDSPEDLKTPVNNMNGFKIPNHPLPSGGFDLGGATLDPSDKQVLCYYSGQLETHSTLLTNAIDAFFTCIENNEPPKVFISNSKFVIVTAHKLVYISDALHRSLVNSEVRNKVMHCANHVCECLKVSVQATKTAALQYPSVPAVQEMVDRVVDVSHAAHELKLVITQASAL